jgi:hypothetical protein
VGRIRSALHRGSTKGSDEMELRIKLAEGETLSVRVNLSPAQWKRRFRRALKRSQIIEVERPNGEILAINPHRVEFMRYGRNGSAPDAKGSAPPQPSEESRAVPPLGVVHGGS